MCKNFLSQQTQSGLIGLMYVVFLGIFETFLRFLRFYCGKSSQNNSSLSFLVREKLVKNINQRIE